MQATMLAACNNQENVPVVDDVKIITSNLRKIEEIKRVIRVEKFEDMPS